MIRTRTFALQRILGINLSVPYSDLSDLYLVPAEEKEDLLPPDTFNATDYWEITNIPTTDSYLGEIYGVLLLQDVDEYEKNAENLYFKGDIKFAMSVGLKSDGTNYVYLTGVQWIWGFEDTTFWSESPYSQVYEKFLDLNLNTNSLAEVSYSIVDYELDFTEAVTPPNIRRQNNQRSFRFFFGFVLWGYKSTTTTQAYIRVYFPRGYALTYIRLPFGIV